jgi:two-component system phosphate regulon response regulator PhoB
MRDKNATVLIVEDTPELQRFLSACFQRMGFDVVSASEGEVAVEIAIRILPDLICLDLMLPNVCGLEVCERLKRSPATAEIPVLVVSSRTSPQDRAEAEIAGADDYLMKPIDPGELAARVRALLDRKAASNG